MAAISLERREAVAQPLLWGHMTSMWWNCDRKPDLTLNPRLLTASSFYRDASCITMHCLHCSAHLRKPYFVFMVMRRMCSTEHPQNYPAFLERLLSPHTLPGTTCRDEHDCCPGAAHNPSRGGGLKAGQCFGLFFP